MNGSSALFDVSVTLAAAVVWLPLVAVSCHFGRARRTFPPFYTQRKVGRDGRCSAILKLRTMVADADSALAAPSRENAEARRSGTRPRS